jgi:hypothetical protein
MVREKTGVNIEYQFQGDFTASQTQYSIMLASDDMSDLISYGTLYFALGGGGVESEMIDQKYVANLADYRAYMPNYLYQVPRFGYDPDMISIIWLNDDMITQIQPMVENPAPSTVYCIRGDWLDRLDGAPQPNDIRTYDQLTDVLTRFKNEIITNEQGYPMTFYSIVELMPALFFGGFDASITSNVPATRVVNGELQFTLTEENDYDALQFFLEWQNAGLSDPNYASYGTTQATMATMLNDGYGLIPLNPGEASGYEQQNVTPGARWDAIRAPAKTVDYKFKYGHGQPAWTLLGYGWTINAKASNVPLLVSYGDYFYSDEGSFDGSWGIEGLTYDYDDKGEPYKTDFVIHNSYNQPIVWFMLAYQQCTFFEPTRNFHLAGYAYPEGQRFKDMFEYALQDYYVPKRDGYSEMDWPSSTAKATQEQQTDVDSFITDANTWFAENYAMFLDGSTPLNPDTWSTYVEQLYAQGYDRYQQIMQNVLDTYLARRDEIAANTQG